ncbi:aminoglycoside phosphotransferase family protein [Streptomyces sp. NPDC046805]|uniref:aminoglycoside phosphotransferase family protein n=1 Tax=Streptomyces sp. NPDC046805 TaxID=3155134 RepID=UPI00340FF7EC
MSTPTLPPVPASEHSLFKPVAVKLFSLVYRSADGTAYVKVYRGIEPDARRDRETDGLQLAARLGIFAPDVRRTGQAEAGPWIEVSAVPGRPCAIGDSRALTHYLDRVFTTTGLLHRSTVPAHEGSHRSHLLSQLSSRCRALSWWPVLHAALADVDDAQPVHLHGDLKPEHFIVEGRHLSVIDWESSTVGPAIRDHADAAFHLVRDLLYAGTSPQHIPVQHIGQLPVIGSALAWRIALWLDRRRPTDIALLAVGDIEALATTATADAAVRTCATVTAGLLSAGVPR